MPYSSNDSYQFVRISSGQMLHVHNMYVLSLTSSRVVKLNFIFQCVTRYTQVSIIHCPHIKSAILKPYSCVIISNMHVQHPALNLMTISLNKMWGSCNYTLPLRGEVWGARSSRYRLTEEVVVLEDTVNGLTTTCKQIFIYVTLNPSFILRYEWRWKARGRFPCSDRIWKTDLRYLHILITACSLHKWVGACG